MESGDATCVCAGSERSPASTSINDTSMKPAMSAGSESVKNSLSDYHSIDATRVSTGSESVFGNGQQMKNGTQPECAKDVRERLTHSRPQLFADATCMCTGSKREVVAKVIYKMLDKKEE